jgi:hypothetical protein
MRKILWSVVASIVLSCAHPAYAQDRHLDIVDPFTGAVPTVEVQGFTHETCTAPTLSCASTIVFTTYAEFPNLANDGMNGDAMEELLRRMIWHLQRNGLQAARQKNPSGRISTDKLAAFIDGQWRAYDVLSDRADPGPFRVGFDEVPGANPQPNDPRGPIADDGGAPPPPPPPSGGTNILEAVQQHEADSAARDAALQAQVDATKLEVLALRVSLEEHRLEARKTRSTVLGFLGNWRNYVKIAAGVFGTLVATGDIPMPGGGQ